MSTFKPTYLYIKQHNQTKLKYFGKTTVSPLTYPGSGKHWRRHLKVHGKDVSTIWYKLFTDPESLTEFAKRFSVENNIVESSEWANLIPENGFDGAPSGAVLSESAKTRMRAAWTDSRRAKQSAQTRLQNLSRPTVTCPHCGRVGQEPNMIRYHFENCTVVKPRPTKAKRPNFATAKATTWILKSPAGEHVQISNMREFCRKHNLNPGTMTEVALGNRKQHKGWTVISRNQCDDSLTGT